jgi:predicted dipeptidase
MHRKSISGDDLMVLLPNGESIEFVDFHWDEMRKDLIESLRIPSIREKKTNSGPFGSPIDKALRHALDCAERLGFRTCYGDGYYGYAEIGEGRELIGILCHIDVVPAGDDNQWEYPPFEGIEKDNCIWGRGALDDKGPLFAVMYAMKGLTEKYQHLGKRIRLIIGTDEENSWECVEKYKANEEMPNWGFSPDAEFPVVYSEKGMLQLEVTSHQGNKNFRLLGGTVPNSVPEKCKYYGPDLTELEINVISQKMSYLIEDSAIAVFGKAAHSSVNWQGKNAITMMCTALNPLIYDPIVNFVAEKIGNDPYGRNLFRNIKDLDFGLITINPGVIIIDENNGSLKIDIRYPININSDEIIHIISSAAVPYGLDVTVKKNMDPLYVSKSDEIVAKLYDAYTEITGDKSMPIIAGGSTYAKAFKRFVSFGPLFPGEQDLAHSKDERVSKDALKQSIRIYYRALEKLVMNN